MSYLKIFFRRKWLFIIPLWCGFVLGIILFLLVKPDYESYTTILVEEQSTINPLIQNLAVTTSAVQRLQKIREQILGWNNLTDLISKLNLDRNVSNPSEYEELVKILRKKVNVQMNVQNIVRISFQSKNPQEALLVTKSLSESFIEENLRTQTKETDVAIAFIKEQLQVYKRKIKESEVNDLEDQLKKLMVDATPEHPLVKELQQKLNVARQELDSGEYKVEGKENPMNPEIKQALTQELDRLSNTNNSGVADTTGVISGDTSPGSPGTAIYKMFLIDKLESAQARDIRVNEQIYNMLLQRLETAKITQRLEASKQGTRYTVIDPPRLPLRPKKPKILMLAIGIFLGLSAGVGLVFVSEMMDQSFIDIDDAKQTLSLPVLAAISRITTDEEISALRWKKTIGFFIGSFVSLALIIIAILLAFARSK
jgi:uncharacterized protein involved in exopolysaccharide biosynthesis